ncbi:glycosyltransferase family 2 protein [Winogradskyella ursingii]|uniref:glycosyltransferase family 2 protein n=1 Tax=Winogradskyella ursingii TaxID=2686079 RepID=UPI0015CACEEE|nr:glycosyltransferase [Winogradskyella ursingii]
MQQADISIIVPVYNESENLRTLYSRLLEVVKSLQVTYQIIFIDDCSGDDSMAKILKISRENPNVYFLSLTRNFGHQVAVSAGLNYCNAEAVVIIDADLQDPPEIILDLYREHQKGFDVVYAKRAKRKGESLLKKITAKLYYRLLKRLVTFKIPLDAGDFRLISKKVVDALNQMPEHNKFLRGQIAWLGFKESYVVFDRDTRKHGKSGYSFGKMMRLAFDGITGFSDKPLLFVSRLGFIISLFSFLIIVYAAFSHFVLEKTITGWTSLIICVAFVGGIQLLSIGVIGEYISRINSNVQKRPLYIVNSTNIKSEANSNES